MKRLTALLCLGALVLFASDVGAQSFTRASVKQLRWADYANGVATTFRDTTTLPSAYTPDTTEVLDMTTIGWYMPGMDVAGTKAALVRVTLTSYNTNADSFYIAVDGAISPAGPWHASSFTGHLGGLAGDAVMSAHILFDNDLNTGVTLDEVIGSFPFIRFRVLADQASGLTFSGARFYLGYQTQSNEIPKMAWQQLRWINLAGIYGDGAANGMAGQYVSVSYADTSSIFQTLWNDTSLIVVDTTEAFPIWKTALLGSGRGASGTPSVLRIGVSGTAVGTNVDSVTYYVDTAPTPNGPWKTGQEVVTGARGTDGANFVSLPLGTTTAAGNDFRTQLQMNQYMRIRARFASRAGAVSGIRGAKAYIMYPAADN